MKTKIITKTSYQSNLSAHQPRYLPRVAALSPPPNLRPAPEIACLPMFLLAGLSCLPPFTGAPLNGPCRIQWDSRESDNDENLFAHRAVPFSRESS